MAKKKGTMRRGAMRRPRDPKTGRFVKRMPKKKRKSVPGLTVRRSVPAKGGREFVQRYFIDKFKRNGNTEYEVWTVSSKGTPPLQTKKQVLTRVKSIV